MSTSALSSEPVDTKSTSQVQQRRSQRPAASSPSVPSLQFCPTCANLLQLDRRSVSGFRLFCTSCPYTSPLTRRLRFRHELQRKAVDDVLGGADAWRNVDSTEALCSRCGHTRAFFMQIQTRSADEPMTTFYKCCNQRCSHQWKEN